MNPVRIVGIKHLAVHDGPGIRSTVFLKGCPLRCLWCHNPERVRPEPEIALRQGKCGGCGACAAVCSCHHVEGNLHTIDRKNCIGCGRCVEACLFDALTLYGQEMTVEAVLAEVLRDRGFYAESGGGVTVSGGEPMLQIDFLTELFRKAKAQGIHTTLDTSGNPFTREGERFEKIRKLLKVTDLVMLDIKHIDDEQHKILTGQTNRNILDMARYLDEIGKPMWIRHVLVPERSDKDEYLIRLDAFIQSLHNVQKVEVLPYHTLGAYNWKELGYEYPLEGIDPPTQERFKNANQLLHTGARV